MKTLNTIFLALTMFMTLAIADLSSIPQQQERKILYNVRDHIISGTAKTQSQASRRIILGPIVRIPLAMMTCDKYPKACRGKGSSGPDCCKKRCVDTALDRLNCGVCGRKCKFSEMCCKGKCVNPMSDGRNCGSCNNSCGKGNSCVYGMCSYGN